MSRTALITGCSSGFGHRLAERLLHEGWAVVATDPALGPWVDHLPHPERRTDRALDVRDPAAIARVVGELDRLDLLVNNGGYAIFTTQEEVDPDAIADLFAVNVVGVARMTRAALPLLRASGGTVVNLSSVAGRTVFPESGFYAATKHAVEAMSDALAQEVGPLGVKVRVIEPGSFDTQFLPTAAACSPAPPPGSPYAALRPLWQARKASVLEPPQDPALVVEAIVSSLDRPAAFERVVVGDDARRILAARDLLGPDGFTRLGMARNGTEGAFDADGLDDITAERLRELGHLDPAGGAPGD